jgi:hypothetical protein
MSVSRKLMAVNVNPGGLRIAMRRYFILESKSVKRAAESRDPAPVINLIPGIYRLRFLHNPHSGLYNFRLQRTRCSSLWAL